MCQCVASAHPRRQACEVAPNRGGEQVTIVRGDHMCWWEGYQWKGNSRGTLFSDVCVLILMCLLFP